MSQGFDLSDSTFLAAESPFVEDIPEALDPRLQRLLARHSLGQRETADTATAQDEVAVIACVTDLAQWEALSEVRAGATLGQNEEGLFLATARIPISRIEAVRAHPCVVSLKASQTLSPLLTATLAETQARPDLLPVGAQSNGGAGVVVGVVDYGCDFAHQNFLAPDGSTRLLCLWHQDGTQTANSPVQYGRKFTRDAINHALSAVDPYAALGYGPPADAPFQSKGTHGTHVLDIVAGNGRGSQQPGLAPQADLIFVDVSHRDLPSGGPAVLESSFGDSARLLEALKFIFDEAGERPCVINVSLGTNGGPHDGSTLVEQGIDALINAKPNRAVVIAAANAFEDGIHAAGQVPANGALDLVWRVPKTRFVQHELELWHAGAERLTVELLAADGTSLLTVAPGQKDGLVADGQVVVFVANRLQDANNHDNMIGVFLEAGLPAAAWTVRLRSNSLTDIAFHAWIERNNEKQSKFAPPHDNSHTIGSVSCGRQTLVVGSYDAHKLSQPISWFSSAGPTRDGRPKPEISAPGHDVLAAHSRTKTGVVAKSGTSMAAPAVTGIVALILAEALQRGLALSSSQIRQIVIDAARHEPPPAGLAWHERYGHGRLSAATAVQAVMDLAPDNPTP